MSTPALPETFEACFLAIRQVLESLKETEVLKDVDLDIVKFVSQAKEIAYKQFEKTGEVPELLQSFGNPQKTHLLPEDSPNIRQFKNFAKCQLIAFFYQGELSEEDINSFLHKCAHQCSFLLKVQVRAMHILRKAIDRSSYGPVPNSTAESYMLIHAHGEKILREELEDSDTLVDNLIRATFRALMGVAVAHYL